MTPRDEEPKSLKITAISVEDAAKILASAYGRRIDAEQVRAAVDAGGLAHADGRFSLIEYVAYLAGEVTGAHAD